MVLVLALVSGLVVVGAPSAGAAVYPGRNGYVTYVHFSDFFPGAKDIFRRFRDDTNDQQLTFNGKSTAPTWSPDGKQIAYVTRGMLAVMNADGSQHRLLGPRGTSPTWSPDGTLIAFLSKGKLKLTTPVGGPVRTLTFTTEKRANFSPTSNDRILLGKVIYSITQNTKTPVVFSPTPSQDVVSSVDWMPNGTSVVFIAKCGASGVCTEARNAYVAPVAGGARVPVTHRTDANSCDRNAGCNTLRAVAAAPDGHDFLLDEGFNDGGGATCSYALVARMSACDGAGEGIFGGDWQSVH